MIKLFMLIGILFGSIEDQTPIIKSNIYSEFKRPNLEDYKDEDDGWKLLAGELGDVISFQITDIYKGSKYEDICLSELYGEINGGNYVRIIYQYVVIIYVF